MNRTPHQRILMLIENAPYAWDGRVRREANSLTAAGYRVTVICRQAPGQGWCEEFAGVTAYQYPSLPHIGGFVGYVLEYTYALLLTTLLTFWIAVREGFDAIHAHNPPDLFVLVGGFWKLFGKRFVFDQHDLAPEMYGIRFPSGGNRLVRQALLFFERLSCRWADHVVVANESCRRLLIRRTGIPLSSTTVVRNGPEHCHFQAVEPLPHLRQDPRVLIGFIGAMGVQDGVDYLLRSLTRLSTEFHCTNWRCLLVGDGDMVPELKKLAADLRLSGRVQFTGWLDYREVPRYVRSMDICVAPDPANDYTNCSTVIKLMEYMAQSRPIVAFDLAEHRVTAGDSALFAAANDELDFARQIARLIDDAELRDELGRAGRARAASTLAWRWQEPHLIGMYERVFTSQWDTQDELRRGAVIDRPPRDGHAMEGTCPVAGGSNGPC